MDPDSTIDSASIAPLLSVTDLRVGYPATDTKQTLSGSANLPINGLSFELREREVVGLIGDAGSGKSTAALALLGLVRAPGSILGGRVEFDGKDLLSLRESELREIRGKEIGIIVQNPRNALNPMLQVGKQIELAYGAHHDTGRAVMKGKAVEMLNLVGINDPEQRRRSYAHELSGGMAQRALIAMALSCKPRLLIADEPTSGLDVTIQAQFLDEMWSTVQQTGSAMLLITQELGIVANYCDRVLVLHDGRIVEDTKVKEYFGHPQHHYSRAILKLQNEDDPDNVQPTISHTGDEHQTLIQVSDLTKHFTLRGSKKFVQAVQGASFTIQKGRTLGLVGESGSGKTTVGRCLVRLLEPTTGQIMYDGMDIASISNKAMRQYRSRIQIVLQDPFDALNPKWTLGQALEEPLKIHTSFNRRERRARSEALLEMVGLDASYLTLKPSDLGAGALQRINIAKALACEPEFIVLDEPTSALSPKARVELIELLRRLQSELGVSYLFISHDLTTVRYLCHTVAVMYLGQIIEHGTVEQVFESPKNPYSIALLSAHLFPDPTHRRVDNEILNRLEGEIPSPIDLPDGCYLASRCPYAQDTCRQISQQLQPMEDGRTVRCHRVINNEINTA